MLPAGSIVGALYQWVVYITAILIIHCHKDINSHKFAVYSEHCHVTCLLTKRNIYGHLLKKAKVVSVIKNEDV